MEGASMAEPDARAKRWYELTCRGCGGRFVKMVDLLFHPCSARNDARKGRQSRKRRPGRGRTRTKAERLLPAGKGAQ
jgi:hypothetical protein